MPQPHWKGVISFGLVNIPVTLYNSENRAEHVSFHQIDVRNNARIKYLKVNSETGKEVSLENVGKGYEVDKETILPIKKGELEKIAGDNARVITVDHFIDAEHLDHVYIDKSYYLLPEKNKEKGYVILREALKDTQQIGIGKVIISTKEYLAAIAYYQEAIILYTLRYHEAIKPLSDFKLPEKDLKKYKVSPQEITIAKKLIQSMSAPWKPEEYQDEYQVAIHQWIKNKLKHLPTKKMTQRRLVARSEKSVDFVELLKKSLGQEVSKRKTISAPPLKKKTRPNKSVVIH